MTKHIIFAYYDYFTSLWVSEMPRSPKPAIFGVTMTDKPTQTDYFYPLHMLQGKYTNDIILWQLYQTAPSAVCISIEVWINICDKFQLFPISSTSSIYDFTIIQRGYKSAIHYSLFH